MNRPTPSPMPTPDLGSILRLRPVPNGSDRSTDTDAPADTPTATSADTAAPASQSAASPTPRPVTRARNATSAAADPAGAPRKQYLRPLHIQLPRTLHQQLRDTAQTRATTATALLLAAVNATHHQLGDALNAGGTPSGDGAGLFAVPQARKPAEPTVATTIRVTDSQLEALDTLAREHGTDRSRILATATRLYLNQ